MAILPADQRSQIMLLLTLAALAGGYFFWTKKHTPDSEQISTANAESDSLERIIAAAMIRSRLSDPADRKSTPLNSSHQINSYAVFCSKKKPFEKLPDIRGAFPERPATPSSGARP